MSAETLSGKTEVKVSGVRLPVTGWSVDKRREMIPADSWGNRRPGPTSITGRIDGDPRLLRALYFLYRDFETHADLRVGPFKVHLGGVRWTDLEGGFEALREVSTLPVLSIPLCLPDPSPAMVFGAIAGRFPT